jgi:glutamyl-tRNA synthetase
LFQGEYGPRHRADAERFLAEGRAYRCFCTREELDAQRVRAEAGGSAFRYDRGCHRLPPAEVERRVKAGMPFAIRFLLPDDEIAWDDAVHGRISFQGRDLDDFVILRSDGTAIYNLAVVSDDIAMDITHVIRGDDHISNTPKQIALYRAFGHPLPVFAHVPMILGTDGKKLSKRHGATAVGDYQNQGIVPAAMRNFLALLGWSPGGDREILPEDEMVALFTLEGIQKKAAVFDTTKLEWMNGEYLTALPAADLIAAVRRELDQMGVAVGDRDLLPLIDAVKGRARTILQMAERVAVRLDPSRAVIDAKGEALIRKMGPAFAANLGHAIDALAELSPDRWAPDPIVETLKRMAETHGLKLGDAMQPIRVALTGSTVSEPVNELLAVIARDTALSRLHDVARRYGPGGDSQAPA